jgi:hypothetical protein
MSLTERDAAHEAIGGSVRPTESGLLNVEIVGRPILLTFAEAEALARELRRAVFDNAPQMRRVLGPVDGDEVWSFEQVNVALAEGWETNHGLQCPHPECGYVGWADEGDAVFVVDEHERWSRASYERDDDGGEWVGTGGADSDYSGLGYRCIGCHAPVSLPDGLEEEWI